MKTKLEKEIINSMSKNPNNWKSIFYVNKNDPRIIVPKQNPMMGWTINFGHKYSIIGFALIFLILIAFTIFSK